MILFSRKKGVLPLPAFPPDYTHAHQ